MRLPSRRALAAELVARLPQRGLLLLARRLAPRPRLRPHPGWYFDISEADLSLRTGLRREIWRVFPERMPETAVVVRWYDGARLELHLENDLSKCLYVGGEFEPNEFAFLGGYLEDGMTFVDIGANEGVYTVFAASRVRSAGCVIAVEPSARELERLRENLRLNHLAHVRVIQGAVGERDGTTQLAIAEARHAGQNTVGDHVANRKVVTDRLETVALRTLDAVVTEQQLTRVDFVKIDAEGSEARVLAGARQTLARFRPVLQLEVEPSALAEQSSEPSDVADFLEGADYSLWVFDEANGALRPRTDEPWGGNIIAAPVGWSPSGASG